MIIQDLLNLLEARDVNRKYSEKRIKGALDRVILELEGHESGPLSRLTLRYHRLDKAAKLMVERRNTLNAKMKEHVEGLFDAEDVVTTRVVETASVTIMLTKATPASEKKPTLKTDYASVVAELSRLVPELEEKIKEITAKYTEVEEPKDTPVQLRVKSKVEEGIVDTVKGWVSKFLSAIKSWGKDYDGRLAAVKKQVAALK